MRLSRFLLSLSLSFPLLSISLAGFSRGDISKLEDFIYKKGLNPLGADAKDLPYEECKVITNDGHRITSTSVGVLIGTEQFDADFTRFALFCYSMKEKVAYLVPIYFDKDVSVGIALELSAMKFSSVHLHKLDGKTLGKIFGEYSGSTKMVGAGLGLGRATMQKEDSNIEMNWTQVSVICAGLSCSKRKTHMGLRNLIADEVYDHYYIEKSYEVLELTNQRPWEIYLQNPNADIDHTLEMISKAEAELNIPEARQRSFLSYYWINNLQNSVEEKGQHCSASRCTKRSPGISKLLKHMDPDFLETLTFRRVH